MPIVIKVAAEPVVATAPVAPEPEPLITFDEIYTDHKLDPDLYEPEVPVMEVLKDSEYVRVTTKNAKELDLPEYVQLELELNPVDEGETLIVEPDSSIRIMGRPQ